MPIFGCLDPSHGPILVQNLGRGVRGSIRHHAGLRLGSVRWPSGGTMG